jgi:MFS family permease
MKQNTPRSYQVAAATIGNALEWYDFMVFGYLAGVVSQLFFPSSSQYGSLLAATATFGVGFFMRPIGGVLIGMYADWRGRKSAMQLIIMLMAGSMALMAFAPTYAAIGIGAPLIILLARLIQGFATGGEFASSTAFLVELAPANRRGFFGSWQMFGQVLAMVGGTAMGAFITSALSPELLNTWGWRLPFLLGMLIAPVGFWIRRYVSEPEAFVEARSDSEHRSPLREVCSRHRRALLTSMGLIASGTVSTYILSVYMPIFATQQLGLSFSQAFTAQCIGGLGLMAMVPLFGLLSDRIGRKPLIMAGISLKLVLLYPLIWWITTHPSFSHLLIMFSVLGIATAAYTGSISTLLAEQFPIAVRSTGMSLAYNVAVMMFGGTASFVVTWLIHATGTPMSMAWYLMSAMVVGLVSSWFVLQAPVQPDPPGGPHQD